MYVNLLRSTSLNCIEVIICNIKLDNPWNIEKVRTTRTKFLGFLMGQKHGTNVFRRVDSLSGVYSSVS